MQDSSLSPSNDLPFEIALSRLEAILEQMNSGAVSLETSIQLYEEADRLILLCQTKLLEAEQKVELLMKNRQGELLLNADQKPQTQPFNPSQSTPSR